MIAAENVVPEFHTRRSIVAADLLRLQEPAVIFEGQRRDPEGELMWLYTVAGWIDGRNIATMQGGATVGGDVIVIHARNREEADMLAGLGLEDTINALRADDERILDSQAALARLHSVGPIERLNQAIKPNSDKSDSFVNDVDKLRPLVGDDIVSAAGRLH